LISVSLLFFFCCLQEKMAEAEAKKDDWFFAGTKEEEDKKKEITALPDEFLGRWTQRKDNGIEGFDKYLEVVGLPWVKRKLIRTFAKNKFDIELSTKDKEGKEVDGFFLECYAPKAFTLSAPLGNKQVRVTFPRGEAEARAYILDGAFISESLNEEIGWERVTRTINKDGVLTNTVEMVKKKDIEAAQKNGDERPGWKDGKPNFGASHTRYLIKKE